MKTLGDSQLNEHTTVRPHAMTKQPAVGGFAFFWLLVPVMSTHADIVVEYTFSDANAATATNTGTLGIAMNGTITGGSITASPFSADGNGLELGGVSGNGISMPNGFDFGSEFTVSTLARLDSYQDPSSILFDDFGGPGVIIDINSDNKLRFQLTTANDGNIAIFSPGDFPLGSWEQIDAVYNGSNAYLLINGSIVGSAAATGSILNNAVVTPNIGVESDGSVFPWNGAVDDFRIRNTAISVPEPSSFLFLGLIACGVVGFRWKTRLGLYCRQLSQG